MRSLHAGQVGGAYCVRALLVLSMGLMSASTASALEVQSARAAFRGDGAGDKFHIRGKLGTFPQSIESLPSVKVDVGPYSETVPTSLFEQRTRLGLPTARYRYFNRDITRYRRAGIRKIDLDFETGRFSIEGRYLPLHAATNPMPFRLAAGQSDQCVMLSFGERPVRRTAYDYDHEGYPLPGTRRVVIDGTRHPSWTFQREATQSSCGITDIEVKPRAFSANRPAQVRVEVRVPNPAVAGLQVFEVDANLEPIGGPRCTLHDDGRDGDDLTGDRVWSCRLDYFEQEPTLIRLVARATLAGQAVASPRVEVDVVPELIHEDAAVFLESMYLARDVWGAKLAQFGNNGTARRQAESAMRTLPAVWDVAWNDDAFLLELSVDQKNGILFLLPISGSDGRHAPMPAGLMSAAAPEPPLASPMRFARYENVNSHVGAATSLPADDRVKNTRVLFWAPFHDRDLPPNGFDDLRYRFATNGCPRFSVDDLRDQQCTLESVRQFDRYGTLVLASRSPQIFRALELLKEKVAANLDLLETNEQVTAASLVNEVANLFLRPGGFPDRLPGGIPFLRFPRLIPTWSRDGTVVWAVLPSYIREHTQRFPGSVVFAGWENSGKAATFLQAFSARGAGAVIGFRGRSSLAFLTSTANDFFNNMLDERNVHEALAALPTLHDPALSAEVTSWVKGRPTYAGTAGLTNGDFETSTLSGWHERGDARVVARLGPYAAPQAAYMGLISTGLGETVSDGSITQTICTQPGERWLRFDWQLLSEEFRDYCNQGFDDRFTVKVNGTTVFQRSVDQLCAGVLTPLPGLTFDAQNDVFSTGWQAASIDLEPFAHGGSASLIVELGVVDQGDDALDTVVLLDRARVEP